MQLSDFYGLVAVPILVAIGEFLKGQGFPAKRLPIAVLLLAVGLNVVLAWRLGNDLLLGGLVGVVVGLAASGLYSSSKALSGR
jgi:hypothetical protein